MLVSAAAGVALGCGRARAGVLVALALAEEGEAYADAAAEAAVAGAAGVAAETRPPGRCLGGSLKLAQYALYRSSEASVEGCSKVVAATFAQRTSYMPRVVEAEEGPLTTSVTTP